MSEMEIIEQPADAPAPTLAKVQALESVLREFPQEDLPLQHYYPAGLYARRMFQPEGIALVGKMHRLAHLTVLLKGDMTIFAEGQRERIAAPHVWVSEPGAKRAIFSHTDCELMTVHPNPQDLRDLDELEAYLIQPQALEIEFMEELKRICA